MIASTILAVLACSLAPVSALYAQGPFDFFRHKDTEAEAKTALAREAEAAGYEAGLKAAGKMVDSVRMMTELNEVKAQKEFAERSIKEAAAREAGIKAAVAGEAQERKTQRDLADINVVAAKAEFDNATAAVLSAKAALATVLEAQEYSTLGQGQRVARKLAEAKRASDLVPKKKEEDLEYKLNEDMEAVGKTEFFKSVDKEVRSEQAAEEKLRLAKKRVEEEQDLVRRAQQFKDAAQTHLNDRVADVKAAEQSVEQEQQELGHAQDAMMESRMSLEKALGKIPLVQEQVKKATAEEAAARLDLELAEAQAADKISFHGQNVTKFVADKAKLVDAAVRIREHRLEEYHLAIQFGKDAKSVVSQNSETISTIKQRLESAKHLLNKTHKNRARAERELQRAEKEAVPEVVRAKFEARVAAQQLAIEREANATRKAVEDSLSAARRAEEEAEVRQARAAEALFTARKVQEFSSKTAAEVLDDDSDRVPTKPGCYFRRPTGCKAITERLGWTYDVVTAEGSNKNSCLQRKETMNRFCDRADVEVAYVSGLSSSKFM